MNQTDYDLIVIGTGPAASTVARKTREQGLRVVIVEAREFGGTCALRGCNPKKVYVNAANLIAHVRAAEGKLITAPGARIEWADLLTFKREFTAAIPKKSRQSFEDDGIDTFQGTASFVGPQAISVAGKKLSARRVFIGVGAHPAPLQIPGREHIIRSDDFLELESIPPRVAFIGGGYVSLEFSHVVARYGSRVSIVERNERILNGFDPDLTDRLSNYSKQQGIEIHTGAEATGIERHADGSLRLTFQTCGQDQSVDCDLIVHGAGRVPNLEPLNLAQANVRSNEKGIEVDEYLRSTSNPHVFVAGDCAATGQPKLTPTANEEARAVVKNLFAESPSCTPNYGIIPRVAFTTPSISAIGLSEKEAKEKHPELSVRGADSSDWNSMRKTGIKCAGYKILLTKDGQIVGAHLLGHGADETINLFALAMKFRLTADDLKSTLFAFPTFAADIRNMV